MPPVIPAIEAEGRLGDGPGAPEIYSFKQVLERLRSDAYSDPLPSGDYNVSRYGPSYARSPRIAPLAEQFLGACGILPVRMKDVANDHSLRRFVSYVMGAAIEDPRFRDDPGGEPGWIRELALFHSTIYQVLAPGTDTRAFVDPYAKGHVRRLWLRSREWRNQITATAGTTIQLGAMSDSIEEWSLEGPSWYVDLGGSKTVTDLNIWLGRALKDPAVAVDFGIDGDAEIDRLGSSLDALVKL